MKVRPPFIYGLIIVLSICSLQFLFGSYKTSSSEIDDFVEVKDNIFYKEEEILAAILELSKERHIKIESYSKEQRMFRVSGQSLLIKEFLEHLEKEKSGLIRSAVVDKFENKVVMTCYF